MNDSIKNKLVSLGAKGYRDGYDEDEFLEVKDVVEIADSLSEDEIDAVEEAWVEGWNAEMEVYTSKVKRK